VISIELAEISLPKLNFFSQTNLPKKENGQQQRLRAVVSGCVVPKLLSGHSYGLPPKITALLSHTHNSLRVASNLFICLYRTSLFQARHQFTTDVKAVAHLDEQSKTYCMSVF